jgi:hypothetical protein
MYSRARRHYFQRFARWAKWLLILFIPSLIIGCCVISNTKLQDDVVGYGVLVASISPFLAALIVLLVGRLRSASFDPNQGACRLRESMPKPSLKSDFLADAAEVNNSRLKQYRKDPRSVADYLTRSKRLVIDVWVTIDELASERPVSVSLPTGGMSDIRLSYTDRDGSLVKFPDDTTDPPFSAQVRIFAEYGKQYPW